MTNVQLRQTIAAHVAHNWQWTDGSAMTVMNWMFNEPTGGSNCGRISRATSSHPVAEGFYWFDYPCNNANGYICKRRAQSNVYLQLNMKFKNSLIFLPNCASS